MWKYLSNYSPFYSISPKFPFSLLPASFKTALLRYPVIWHLLQSFIFWSPSLRWFPPWGPSAPFPPTFWGSFYISFLLWSGLWHPPFPSSSGTPLLGDSHPGDLRPPAHPRLGFVFRYLFASSSLFTRTLLPLRQSLQWCFPPETFGPCPPPRLRFRFDFFICIRHDHPVLIANLPDFTSIPSRGPIETKSTRDKSLPWWFPPGTFGPSPHATFGVRFRLSVVPLCSGNRL